MIRLQHVLFVLSFVFVSARVEYAKIFGNIHDYAYYFVDVLVGKPTPQRQSVILDTGSSMLAFPCSDCQRCGSHLDPQFKPSLSSTFAWQQCSASNRCKTGSCSSDNVCTYSQSYTEGSEIGGKWFHDYVALGDSTCANAPVKVEMGCHTRETNLFLTQKAAGIMGVAFGVGGRSTIMEALFAGAHNANLPPAQKLNTNMFSICFSPEGGMLAVGGQNVAFQEEDNGAAAYTSLTGSHYYSMQFDNIYIKPKSADMFLPSAGNTIGPTLSGTWRNTGVIVDSGTTFTYFSPSLWKAFLAAVQGDDQKVKPYKSDYCHIVPNDKKDRPDKEVRQYLDEEFPTFIFELSTTKHLVHWKPSAYFFPHLAGGKRTGKYCIAVADNHSSDVVLGASFMVNLDVFFDRQNNRVGFVPSRCPEVKTELHRPAGPVAYSFDNEENAEGDMCIAPFKPDAKKKEEQKKVEETNPSIPTATQTDSPDNASQEAEEKAETNPATPSVHGDGDGERNPSDRSSSIPADASKNTKTVEVDLKRGKTSLDSSSSSTTSSKPEQSGDASEKEEASNGDATSIVPLPILDTLQDMDALASHRKLSVIYAFFGGALAVALAMLFIIVTAYRSSTDSAEEPLNIINGSSAEQDDNLGAMIHMNTPYRSQKEESEQELGIVEQPQSKKTKLPSKSHLPSGDGALKKVKPQILPQQDFDDSYDDSENRNERTVETGHL